MNPDLGRLLEEAKETNRLLRAIIVRIDSKASRGRQVTRKDQLLLQVAYATKHVPVSTAAAAELAGMLSDDLLAPAPPGQEDVVAELRRIGGGKSSRRIFEYLKRASSDTR
jgi:hypothetical protein